MQSHPNNKVKDRTRGKRVISVIIPTYNVENYIDRCFYSIINQSFNDYEVIVIDGNSTDGTIEKIKNWMQKDARIRLYFQKTKGLGQARDEGVKYAKGEYITFIDSDDWWELSYLEKMYQEIKDNDADICMCDRVNYHFSYDGQVINKYPMTKPIMQEKAECYSENPEILLMLEVSANGKLFKKEIFLEYKIFTPSCAAEDRAVMHYLLYRARKITRIREPLYFYHAERGGSLVNTIKAWSTMDICLDTMNSYFEKEYENNPSLEKMVRMMSIETALAGVKSIKNVAKKNDGEAEKLINKIKDLHRKRFPDLFEKQFIIGSYNLRREVWLAYHSFDEIREHQQFSSIISLMSDRIECPSFELNDLNRNNWLKYDFSKEFIRNLSPKKEDYIFIDFMEERFDIGKKGNSYFTWSQLYDEVDNKKDEVERIDRLSDTADILFKEACMKLIKYLLSITDSEHIILVRNHLCSKMGTYAATTLFFNYDWIVAINSKLDKYYDYFIENCPGVNVVSPKENDSFFSYEDFQFGCAPYHANDAFYHNVAFDIRNKIC